MTTRSNPVVDVVDLARRYFEMWNSGEAADAAELLDPDWIDHAHPEVHGPEDVRRSVEQVRAAKPGLCFEIETILAEGELALVVGGVGDATRPGLLEGRLIWLLRACEGRLAEIWTYRPVTPAPGA